MKFEFWEVALIATTVVGCSATHVAVASAEEGGFPEVLEEIQAVAPEVLANVADVPTISSGSTAINADVSGVNVIVPTEASGVISLQSERGTSIGVGLPASPDASRVRVEDGGVVSYDHHNGSVTTLLVKDDGSVQVATVIASASAPTRYAYSLALPEGGEAKLHEGTVVIEDSAGAAVGFVAPPWAKDSTGRSISTRYEINGNSLVQIVDHENAGASYPIVADPWFGVDLIDSFSWSGSGNRRAIHVKVTPMMFLAHHAGAIWAGWDELKSKAGREVDKATYRQQFVCHVVGREVTLFKGNGLWDFEVWRSTNDNFKNWVGRQCNW